MLSEGEGVGAVVRGFVGSASAAGEDREVGLGSADTACGGVSLDAGAVVASPLAVVSLEVMTEMEKAGNGL